MSDERDELPSWSTVFNFPGQIATAEAHGAALAIEQCRRLAEEAIEEILVARELGEPVEWDSPCEALYHFAASLPATSDLAAEVQRIEERGAERLRLTLEAIAGKGCGVIHGGSPKGTTCLDVIAESYAKPDRSADGYKRQIRSRKWVCLPCQARAALDGSEARMFAADLIEGGAE